MIQDAIASLVVRGSYSGSRTQKNAGKRKMAMNEDDADVILHAIGPREHDLGGGFMVRRSLPVRECRSVGPFVFFDHMGPAVLPPERPVDVLPHPHIGLSTLTWLFEGAIMHRDSLGYAQEILPGEVNWMTAGSGIVHSERSPDRLRGQTQSLHGLQIWMALPKANEETAPSFQHYGTDELPRIEDNGIHITVVAGTAWGRESPVSVFSKTLYADVVLEAGAVLSLGSEHEERALYLLSGRIALAGGTFEPGALLVLKPGREVEIAAEAATHLVIIGGAPLDGRRYMWWNFVSSDKDRIERAKADWREGRFAKISGDEEEFVPLPEYGG
jgi:redox-sensitive bicupin YhaK (pirin superfamily)